jgi:hypothetical protein
MTVPDIVIENPGKKGDRGFQHIPERPLAIQVSAVFRSHRCYTDLTQVMTAFCSLFHKTTHCISKLQLSTYNVMGNNPSAISESSWSTACANAVASQNVTQGLIDQNGNPTSVLNNETWGITIAVCNSVCGHDKMYQVCAQAC